MNTMLSLSRTSCQWCMIPKDLLPWECVSCYFIKWKNEDFIVSLVDKLYSNIRVPSHQETPDTGLIDFRNAKTSFHANANRSFNEKGEAGNSITLLIIKGNWCLSLFMQPRFMSAKKPPKSLNICLANNILSEVSYRENVTNRDLDRSNGNLKSCLNPMRIHPNSLPFSNDGL